MRYSTSIAGYFGTGYFYPRCGTVYDYDAQEVGLLMEGTGKTWKNIKDGKIVDDS